MILGHGLPGPKDSCLNGCSLLHYVSYAVRLSSLPRPQGLVGKVLTQMLCQK